MTVPFNLRAYFKRIGYLGDDSPTLENLKKIHALHGEAIAFENLTPYLGEKVELDIVSLQEKILVQRRGGYCYEQNSLLWHALEKMGFRVRGLTARVVWNVSQDEVIARTHMLLLASLECGRHIVDAGFGGMTPTGPLRLDTTAEQVTPHETFRLLSSGNDYTLEACLGGNWKALYSFDLQRQHMADYRVFNWYHSTCPQSPFVKDLIAARPTGEGRHTLLNYKYAFHRRDGKTEKENLTGPDHLVETLRTKFRIRMTQGAQLEDKLKQLATAD